MPWVAKWVPRYWPPLQNTADLPTTKYFLDRSYGFFRFTHSFGKAWVTDTRLEESPYTSVFFMEKDLPPGTNAENLPSRDYIFEFTLTEGEKGFVASDIDLIYKY